jgi:hypothetical protein
MTIRFRLKQAPVARMSIGVLLCVIAFGCIKTPLDPILPASDIQMSIPIIDRTRTVADLFGKDTSKVRQNASGYYYEDDRNFTPTRIDTIKVAPQPGNNRVALGKVPLAGLPPVTQTYTISAFGLTPGAVPGPPAPAFPAQSVTIPGSLLPTNPQFDWMFVDTGSVTLSVTNTMPLQVTFPNGIRLKNNSISPSDTSTVAFFNLGTIDSGKTETVIVHLTNRIIYSALQTDSIKFTTNQRSGPFTINSTDGILFTFSSGSFLVDSAKAIVPPTQLAAIHDSLITIDPTAVLQQARFTKGLFSASITNNTGLSVGANLKFSNFVSTKPSKDTLTINQIIAPQTAFTVNVQMDTIQLVNGSLVALGTTMRFSASISTINSGGNKTVFTANDFVGASFTPQQQFVLKSLTGSMNPLTVNVNTGVPLAGLGDASKNFSGSFDFDSIQVKLNVGLSSGYPVDHNLTLYAINRRVIPIRLDSLNVPPGTIQPGLNTPGTITLNNSTGLSAFLSKSVFADTMYIRGALVINSTRQSGTIVDTTKVYPSMSMFIPLKLGLLGGQYVDMKATTLKKSDSAFVADTKSGTLYFSITNGLPLKLDFRAAFMGINTLTHARDTLLWIPPSRNGTVYTVNGAQVNNLGSVTNASATTFNISLADTLETHALAASDSVYIKVTLNTSGSQGPPVQAVKIRVTDYIRIRASANAVYTVNKK